MEEFIRVHDQSYILATSARVDDRTRILKHNETFAVFDRAGNIQPFGLGEQGIYHEDTRYLSRLELMLAHRRPILLGSTVQEDRPLLSVDLTNPDIPLGEHALLPRDTIHLSRYAFLWNCAYYSCIRLRSFFEGALNVDLTLQFEADFADVFEVRGAKRERRGTLKEPVVSSNAVLLRYEGLDGGLRAARLEFDPEPSELSGNVARFRETIAPGQEKIFFLNILFQRGRSLPVAPSSFHTAADEASNEFKNSIQGHTTVETSNDQFNHWVNRSAADLRMMITQTPLGEYPYAGVPWYSTVFGRDGIITAYEYLAFYPQLAAGVLKYLAAKQATEANAEQDAQPGKILHELRQGEMAILKEVPFGQYYGSVDATPLFVMLAGAYFERTGDAKLIDSLWTNILRALEWIDHYGDMDSDGFVEYQSTAPRGLTVQGWKDSHDSVFHRDGALVEPPIALCEVQAYVYAARQYAAMLATAGGQIDLAARLRDQAFHLRQRFDEAFWSEELGTFAEALDRHKRACMVRTSNAGQCLYTGIVKPQRIHMLVQTIMREDSFTGWGIRTVAEGEARFNPMSYHNGSIWPHDNALIAAGLARAGRKSEAIKILDALFEASKFVELNRMPELICGFVRRPGEGPTQYPVACAPQAWSAAAVFLLLQSCLGISFDAPGEQIRIDAPAMPPYLRWITMRNLSMPNATVDLHFQREGGDVVVGVPRKEGHVEIIVVK